MLTVSVLVLTFSLYIYSEAAYVDTLPKCTIKDTECIKEVYHHMLKNVGSTGIEELGVPPLDPMEIKNLSLTILNAVTIIITEGSVKGMSNCVFNNFKIDWEKEKGYWNITCDALSVKGKFVISGENAELQSIFGSNNLNGQGKVKVKLNNLNMNLELSMHMIKKDGEIYLPISNKNIKHTYDFGHVHFITEKVIIANNDLSQIVTSYLNGNWKHAMEQFGPEFIDKLLKLFIGIVGNAFNKIPANKYITDDLNSYVKQ